MHLLWYGKIGEKIFFYVFVTFPDTYTYVGFYFFVNFSWEFKIHY